MKGNVIGFDPDTNTGAISGHDGQRYDFATSDWHSHSRPQHGDLVDFVAEGQRAAQIYLLEPEYVAPSFGQFLFSARGRISRSQFWLKWFLPVVAIHLILGTIIIVWAVIAITAVSERSSDFTFASILAVSLWPITFFMIWVIFWLATLWPSTAILVKRIHDRNKTGWLVLAYYTPAILQVLVSAGAGFDSGAASIFSVIGAGVAIWFFVEFGCMRGTVGANQYGADPVPGS